jgi:hypothetical protein
LTHSLLPEYAPVPRSALGPAVNEQGITSWAASTRWRTHATPVIEKYTGILAAADVFSESTTFHVMQSLASISATVGRCTPDGARG